MAKFSAEYKNRVPKYILTFRGKEFDFSMNQKLEYGTSSDKPCFSKQLSDAFEDLNEDELEETDIDQLDSILHDEEELFEILERVEELE
ncbi:MAG: hypothetical protein K0R00_206 [Herbinix sp.]|jgi:hypothetical protein|nr:hypothetical protein [Herbinix sp.]